MQNTNQLQYLIQTAFIYRIALELGLNLGLNHDEIDELFYEDDLQNIPEGDTYWVINPDDLIVKRVDPNEEGFSKDDFDGFFHRDPFHFHYKIY